MQNNASQDTEIEEHIYAYLIKALDEELELYGFGIDGMYAEYETDQVAAVKLLGELSKTITTHIKSQQQHNCWRHK